MVYCSTGYSHAHCCAIRQLEMVALHIYVVLVCLGCFRLKFCACVVLDERFGCLLFWNPMKDLYKNLHVPVLKWLNATSNCNVSDMPFKIDMRRVDNSWPSVLGGSDRFDLNLLLVFSLTSPYRCFVCRCFFSISAVIWHMISGMEVSGRFGKVLMSRQSAMEKNCVVKTEKNWNYQKSIMIYTLYSGSTQCVYYLFHPALVRWSMVFRNE